MAWRFFIRACCGRMLVCSRSVCRMRTKSGRWGRGSLSVDSLACWRDSVMLVLFLFPLCCTFLRRMDLP